MRRIRFVDIVMILEAIYILLCVGLSTAGELQGASIIIKFLMIAASSSGIIYVWYKHKAKVYINKGLLFMTTALPLMWNVLLLINV